MNGTPTSSPPAGSMPLATSAAHRILAWPRYDQAADLEALARGFGPELANNRDVCLCLRHDETADIPVGAAITALNAAFAAALGESVEIDVLLIDNPLDEAAWHALGASITEVLALPSSAEPARHARLAGLGHQLLVSGAELRRRLNGDAEPRVTALVSTYKSAAFMKGCLDDLVSQTLFARGELEILVIDSGSPENEGDVVREMQQRFPGIRYVRTERETLYAAWNRGIKLARGQYLTSANTDDRHRNDAMEVLARHLDANPQTAVAYADSLVTRQPHETFAKNSAEHRLNWPVFSYAELQRRCIVGPQPLWRKSLHERWGLFEDRFTVSGDYEFWLRIGRTERLELVPQILGLYYENHAGLEYASGRTIAETVEIQRRYGVGVDSVAPGAVNGSSPAAAPSPAPRPAPATPPAAGVAAAKAKAPDPVVSVIIPTFNRPDFLRRALTSLTAQTFQDFEVLVVNDAGVPLEGVLEAFAPSLDITYVRHGVNRDRAAARNTAVVIARGRYIAYLDDDDSFRPEHLQTLVDALADGQHKVAYSDATWILEEPTANGYDPVRPIMDRSMAFDRDRLMVGNYIPILSVMHERACLDEVGGFDDQLGTHEDWDLFIRLAVRYPFLHVPKVTAAISWREDGSSTTSAKSADFLRTMLVIHQRYHHMVKDNPSVLAAQAQMTGAAPPAKRDPATEVVDQARAQVSRGELDAACKTLSASLDLAPQSADLLLTLADVFAAQGKPQVAGEVLQQASLLHPANAQVRSRLQQAMAFAAR